ncbi:TM2 domain-containing protein [Cellulophaga sp. F20128]|uniref:TM2 domain-containing protein n=1 Tax=Cellulophaga sp. F20128 TaxID=2926413 RepID=UPI001FF4AE0A|nr:TM2 domain-containing protein [Cellulophaga sp. F20128]MCK0155664.1 TM2 domain-containing protein [Cellulophaga sp. F20128]
MSEENKDLGDKAKEAFEDAKGATKDFAEDAKHSAKEFTDSAKETFNSGENKKILAGILAIVLGGFGVHKFILGYNKEGIIMLVVSIVGWFLCGIPSMLVWIVGLIEGIMYLTKSDQEFYNTYQVGRKPWF